LMQVRGESLAADRRYGDIRDAGTHKQNLREKKDFALNTIKLPFADEAIKVLESGYAAHEGVPADSFLKEESVDVETQFAQLASGSQQSLTDERSPSPRAD